MISSIMTDFSIFFEYCLREPQGRLLNEIANSSTRPDFVKYAEELKFGYKSKKPYMKDLLNEYNDLYKFENNHSYNGSLRRDQQQQQQVPVKECQNKHTKNKKEQCKSARYQYKVDKRKNKQKRAAAREAYLKKNMSEDEAARAVVAATVAADLLKN
ncbi:hypothetical protein HCN44_003346 [Aphidius gifuensis]|uniref:Uncharacterized protein n=1 Tax=Aphidius gifuensis TaxID=684658 RepID=A0A834XWW0_APHGI|nr:hypothetical protein HCN44_003346 [Aphidius gifuensis]